MIFSWHDIDAGTFGGHPLECFVGYCRRPVGKRGGLAEVAAGFWGGGGGNGCMIWLNKGVDPNLLPEPLLSLLRWPSIDGCLKIKEIPDNKEFL